MEELRTEPALLSIDDIAAWLGVAKRTVHTWRSLGQLPPDLAIGMTRRWHRHTLAAWMERRAAPRAACRAVSRCYDLGLGPGAEHDASIRTK